jgi:hypothetical protein
MMSVVAATAQQSTPASPPGAKWQHVQALPEGTSIRLRATSRSAACKLENVDADSLTCASGTDKEVVFQRGEVKWIKIHHRGRSAAAGGAIGIGLGTGSGVANGALGGDWGGTVATDFTHSTVYKGP